MKHITYTVVLASITLIIACKQVPETAPQRKDIVDAVFASGSIIASNQYAITAQAEGYLSASFVSEGDTVHNGQLLFKLANDAQQIQVSNAYDNYDYAKNNLNNGAPQIVKLEEQINQAISTKDIDAANLKRYENLIKTNAVAQVDYDKVKLTYQNDVTNLAVLQKSLADLKQSLALNEKNAKAQYQLQQNNNQYYALSSANAGIVLSISKKNGDLVKKGESIAVIGSGKTIAKLYVAEDDIQKIQLHQQTLITLNTNKDQVYGAKVTKIYPSFDVASQSFIVEASFDDLPTQLKNGTQLQANFIISQKKNALVVPSIYVLPGDSVITKANHQKIAIKTGIKTLEWVEVTGGLNDSEKLELPK
ncbi:efflux RND transporter periplasmic adaptor subunit [Parasediminibacterium paludis]|uniref:Efflux RND transporter periplasmic adaptor subunit n=1 Tax=Parasediminibacterium paludis TaxID=908966 RepID=A0ABV8PZJ9_9BACT